VDGGMLWRSGCDGKVLRCGAGNRHQQGGCLAIVLCAVTAHTRRMGHNGLHAGGMHWRGHDMSTRASLHHS
jgi:hypothetical protein